MTLSKQLFSLLFIFFFFRLLHASNPKECPSSYLDYMLNSCIPHGLPKIHFPFCGDARFNLHCNELNQTVIELPMSGTFLVENINYDKQQISINDPDNCLVKRLLNFTTSGTPFSPRYTTDFTFLTCPNEALKLSWYPSISCLSNSTTSFFATSNLVLAKSMLPSCQIVKRVTVPIDLTTPLEDGFSDLINVIDLLLEWSSPDCKACEREYLRCGFKNKATLEVKCFTDKHVSLSTQTVLRIAIPLCSIVGITIIICLVLRFDVFQRRENVATAARAFTQQQTEIVVVRGLDQSTIDSYEKVKLGESRRLPGTNNGIICPICLSEYASQDTVRCIPDCDHCFHVECIDPWLKIHGSCPVCRNTHS